MTIRALQYAIQHLIDERGIPDTAIVVAKDNTLYAEWEEKAENGKEEWKSMQLGGYVRTKEKRAELSNMQKEWFANLIDKEINKEVKAAQNEYLGALGADDKGTSSLHGMNEIEHIKYATFLEGLKETYIGTN